MKYLLLLALNCHAMVIAAQKKNPNTVKPLMVGDTVQNFTFRHVLNYTSSTAKLSDFKRKLVVIDMWSTYCSSCIEAFPEMQALQDQFKNKIQVVLADPYPATSDPDDRIKKVLERAKERTGLALTLPVAVHDTMLNHLFPHQTVPHVIVISTDGVIAGTTYSWAVTKENIRSVLAGEKIHFPLKNDWGFDKNMPLFVNGNGGDGSDFIYRSIITPYEDGVPAYMGSELDSTKQTARFYMINYPLLTLYRIAYSDVFKYTANRTFIETPDSAKFAIHYNEEEDNKNSYCYELITPPSSYEQLKQFMQQDLFRTFHAIAKNEQRTIKCFILKTSADINNSTSTSDSAATDIEKTSLHKFIHNQPVSVLAGMLNDMLPLPVINETGFTQNISFEFPFGIYDYNIHQWKDFLLQHGFELTETERNMEVTVITDKP